MSMTEHQQYELERQALLQAGELAAQLPTDSVIRGLFLRNAAAYKLAASARRHLEAVTG